MKWFDTYHHNAIRRNATWMMLGLGVRLLVQALYFVLIARTLGAEQYGAFAAVAALTAVVAPLVGLGSASLLVKNVARDRSLLCEYWGNGLCMTFASSLGGILLVVAAGQMLLPSSVAIQVIVLVAIADAFFSRFVDLACVAFQAVDALGRMAQLTILISACRLLGIVSVAFLSGHPDAGTWSVAYLIATSVAAGIAVLTVSRELGRPRLALRRIPGELREGLSFAVGLGAQMVYNDIDKSLLARLATLESAGIYSAAYRLIDVAFVPVRSLLYAAYAGFFRAGTNGILGAAAYLKRLLPPAAIYSVLCFALMMFGAPLIHRLLGPGFAQTAEALRWLSVLPLLKTVHCFMSDTFTGAGYQSLRTLLQGGIAVINLSFNLWLIPAYGWRGAAWSSLTSDGLLVVCMTSILLYLRHRPVHTVESEVSVA